MTMATDLIPKQFKVSAEVWADFVSACSDRGTFPSAALRDFCEAYIAEVGSGSGRGDTCQKQPQQNFQPQMESGLKEVIFKVFDFVWVTKHLCPTQSDGFFHEQMYPNKCLQTE